MADKNLKSLTFPGLPDTYVIPDYSGDIAELQETMAGKQDALTFDAAPAEDSENPVTSGGVFTAVQSAREAALAAFPTENASGPIASFDDGAEGVPVKSLKVSIEPVQEGSGDPSPENVRPITGWTGASVQLRGKNHFQFSPRVYTGNPQYYVFTGAITASGANNGITVPPHTTMYVEINFSDSPGTNSGIYGTWTDEKTQQTKVSLGSSLTKRFTVENTTDTEREYAFWAFCNSGGSFASITATCMASLDEYSDYEPYSSEIYPISWETDAGTVYGGTLDVTSGELTVDKLTVEIRSLEVYSGFRVGAYSCIKRYSLPRNSNNVEYNRKHGAISSLLNESTAYHGNDRADDGIQENRFAISTTGAVLAVYDTDLTIDDSGFSAKYEDMQVCYPLATPITYQLTPAEVKTLLGNNNIWADTGDVDVTYRADPDIYAMEAMGNLATVETTSAASRNYTVGELLVYGGTLYTVTETIASGGTITPGDNVAATTVEERLSALDDKAEANSAAIAKGHADSISDQLWDMLGVQDFSITAGGATVNMSGKTVSISGGTGSTYYNINLTGSSHRAKSGGWGDFTPIESDFTDLGSLLMAARTNTSLALIWLKTVTSGSGVIAIGAALRKHDEDGNPVYTKLSSTEALLSRTILGGPGVDYSEYDGIAIYLISRSRPLTAKYTFDIQYESFVNTTT